MPTLFYIYKRALAWLHRTGRLVLHALWPARQNVRQPRPLIYPGLHKASQRFAARRLWPGSRAAPPCPARFFFGPYAHGPPIAKS